LKYLIEIWHANEFPPSLTYAVTKPQPRSRFSAVRPPSWKLDMTS